MSETICPACAFNNPAGTTTCTSCGAPLRGQAALHPLALPVGTTFQGGDYRIDGVLGQGGFGITYRGSQESPRRSVAIKEFFPSSCRRQGLTVRTGDLMSADDFKVARDRFLEEARALSRFGHPGIVRIYGYFEENETAYISMERLSGKTLAKLLEERKEPLPEREALGYVERVSEALIEVHQAGLLHRDIKPDNVVATEDDRVVLIDFGSARTFAAWKTSRMTAALTPGYAPLEQYGRQARFGPFTDIYALGATLYHLLTGEPPVAATDRAAGVELPPVRKINPAISEGAERAVTTALQIAVKNRPQNISEWLALLKAPSAPSTPKPASTDSVKLHQAKPGQPRIRINQKDGAELVFVPAGEFAMGSDEDEAEKPIHKVYLDDFWIYKTPVTVAQFRNFCSETSHSMPSAPRWGWKDDHPIVHMTWHAADAYAKWAGARLPTEAEWEKAARGTDGRKYPWGNEWDASRLQCSEKFISDAKSTAPVGSYPSGASPYGALDMAGNVWEWCADWYDPSFYKLCIFAEHLKVNPKGGFGNQIVNSHVLRGGSWANMPMLTPGVDDFRAAHRGRIILKFLCDPYAYGFRCAI